MAQRSAGTEHSRETASEPAGRRERSPAPAGEVPKLLQLGTALGNRTTTALLAGGLLQRKVAIGPADDPLEREADRTAERVLARPEGAAAEGPAQPRPAAGGVVRRECAACAAGGQPCAECREEEEQKDAEQRQPAASPADRLQRRCADCEGEEDKLQRQAAGQPAGGPAPAQVDSHLAALGPGRPLASGLRSYFEPRFGHDFGGVRLHTGTTADAAAHAARARAFTLRQDVVFAAGEYTPATRGGRRLLAHELAHVVQQAPPAARRQPVVRRQATAPETPASATPMPPAAGAERTAETMPETTPEQQAPATREEEPGEAGAVKARSGEAPRGFIVPDDAQAEPGQMTKSTFLAELHTAACAAAEEGLAGTERSARGCPWLEHYFRLYAGMSAERIEADLLRYVPAARSATTARDYIVPAADHIRTSVRHWAETGELTGVPQGFPGMGLLGAIGGSLAGLGRMLFKARPGGARGPAQPAAVAARLGPGSSLGGSVRSRMERAFGSGLGGVRLHTDTTAARLAGRFNARAFTVGRHVAFGRGEYRPGTLAGDALLAHELAHTEQQRAGGPAAASASDRPLERDADRSAAGAVAALWTDGGLRLRRGALPRRHAGLRLSRCAAKETDFSTQQLADYLTKLRRSRSPAGGDGDVKARAVIHRHLDGDADFRIVDVPTRVLLIKELQQGWTDVDDEKAILSLLRDSPTSELQRILDAVGVDSLREDFDGAEFQKLQKLLEGQKFEHDIESLGGWSADGVMEILHRHGDESAIRTLLDQGYKVLRFTKAEDQWREADRTVHWEETPVIGNTCRIVEMGCPEAKVIRIYSEMTNEQAAATFFHEAQHAAQPEPADRPEGLKQEVDARVAEEEYRIRHGMPPKQPSYRRADGTVDRAAIEKDIEGSPHYNPTTRRRIGRRYLGEVEVTGWRLP